MDAPEPTPRQTLSYLIDLFRQQGIRPKSKLGQNFLIDLNLLDLIVQMAELSSNDLAIEVGSGTGSLTSRLASLAGAVLSVEIDPVFHNLTRATVANFANVVLTHADILENKNKLNPDVCSALATLQRQSGCQRLKLVANLPFAVATPVIANFLIADLPMEAHGGDRAMGNR